jgi:FKBP-type peptidyl-prolyl cis-trans isomerase
VTDDMFDGQTPEDVTNAIIGAALESGKSQTEIESVMSGGSAPEAEATPAADATPAATQSTAQTDTSTDTASAAKGESSGGALAKLEEVKVEVTKEGKGKACKDGDIATMNYTGKLYQDQSVVFDSSIPRGEAFDFTVGGYTVIKCW